MCFKTIELHFSTSAEFSHQRSRELGSLLRTVTNKKERRELETKSLRDTAVDEE